MDFQKLIVLEPVIISSFIILTCL
jgi:tetratricopeptide (TPR) repeat protein